MQNVLALWSAMTLARRAMVVGATVAMFGAVLLLSRMASTPDMALLYSGLDPAAAGEVVAALDQANATYEIQGDAIRVAAAERDRLRMMLAGQGLPAAGSGGYELLDGLSGFGTTSQMFDAAYLRAKEGELARTILAMPGIRAARVHVAQGAGQPFRRDLAPTASVTLTTSQGALTPQQARALKYLVAGAVAGMRVDDVAVIDSARGLVDGAETPPATDRAEELRRNVERLLAARVGAGNAVVEVSIDTETTRESIVERRFDPQGRVPISSSTVEKTASDQRPSGDVTVASNLPDGDAAGRGGEGRSSNSETQETINYEVSETQREVLRQPGAVKRITVAVLVDGLMQDGQWVPRPEAEMTALQDLVASAVGLDTARGDVLTLRSLQFTGVSEAGTLAETGWMAALDTMRLVQIAALALVALILGLFVVRPILTRTPAALEAPAPMLALPGAPPAASERPASDEPLLIDAEPADPVDRLRRMIETRQVETIEILRGWMDKGERA